MTPADCWKLGQAVEWRDWTKRGWLPMVGILHKLTTTAPGHSFDPAAIVEVIGTGTLRVIRLISHRPETAVIVLRDRSRFLRLARNQILRARRESEHAPW